MKNLLKVAALGLALTAGLTSCSEKKTESTTIETPAAGTDAMSTTTDSTSTMSTAPAADGAMAPAAGGAMAPAAGTTTTTTEEKK